MPEHGQSPFHSQQPPRGRRPFAGLAPLAPTPTNNTGYPHTRRDSSASASTFGTSSPFSPIATSTNFSPLTPYFTTSPSTPFGNANAPLQCCGHTFVNTQTLKRHQREVKTCPLWMGPHPTFTCIYCKTTCKRKSGLKQHLTEKHPELERM